MRSDGLWRVALVHSFYRSDQPSGEDAMVEASARALQRAGHEVQVVGARTDELSASRLYPVAAALRVATHRGRSPRSELDAFAPDVVHVHNLFPNYGRTWVERTTRPLVATLHNYRPLCAAATFFRDGHVCTDCVTDGPRAGLEHGCYRGSRPATLPLTLGQLHPDPLLRRADRLVVLSQVQAELYAGAGVGEGRTRELANFVPDELDEGPGPGGDAWLFAGRLTTEKGLDTVLASWPADVPLRVVGTGPLLERVRSLAEGKDVELLGIRSRAQVLELMRTSRGLVFPSRWADPFGLVYAEALASGTPVLATPPSAAARLVVRDGAGLAVEAVTEDVVRAAHAQFAGLRQASRAAFERSYAEAAHVSGLLSVYAEAVQARGAQRPGGAPPDGVHAPVP